MTNDELQASIAAALVSADLTFTSATGPVGDQPVRVFQLTFGFSEGRHCEVTGYVTGNVLVALAPLRIGDPAKRREIAEAIAQRIPMARLVPSPPEFGDQSVAWVEASVPVPTDGGGAPAWLIVPPFMSVAAAVDHAITFFPPVVSLAPDQTAIPMLSTIRAPQVHETSDWYTVGPGAAGSVSIRVGPLKSGGRITMVAEDGNVADLFVSSFKVGNVDRIIGGVVPASIFAGNSLVGAGKVVTVRAENRGSVEKRVRIVVQY